MSRPAYVTFLLFVWISLVYVIIAFADVTAGTFANFQSSNASRRRQHRRRSRSTAARSSIGATAYLVLSIALGLLLRFTKLAVVGRADRRVRCAWR